MHRTTGLDPQSKQLRPKNLIDTKNMQAKKHGLFIVVTKMVIENTLQENGYKTTNILQNPCPKTNTIFSKR